MLTYLKSIPRALIICSLALFLVLIKYIDFNSISTPIIRQNISISKSVPFNLASNRTQNSSLPVLCFLVRVYWAQLSYFPVLAFGLYHNGLHNIHIYVVNTDNQTDIHQLKQTINFINQLVLDEHFVRFLDLGQPPSSAKDFGYTMTDRALTYFYNQTSNSSSPCQYITFTNGDNFYSRNLAKRLLVHMQNQEDIIGWDFISHHFWPQYIKEGKANGSHARLVDSGTEKHISNELKTGAADLGAAAYRLAFLKAHNLHFGSGEGSYSMTSDGAFITQAVGLAKTSVILRQTFLFHQ